MEREIVRCEYTIEEIRDVGGLADDPATWLVRQGKEHDLTTLLAHACDGVIWGRMNGARLVVSHEVFNDVSPELRPETLQQARLFSDRAELLAWRDGEGEWQARLLRDGEGAGDRWCFDEPQILWGDDQEGDSMHGFTCVTDGQQGLRHVVPLTEIPFTGSGERPLRLGVRHYLEADEDGMLTIVHSRLTGVWADGVQEVSRGQVA